MALKPRLDIRQTQRISLTPGLVQTLSLLQLSTIDLIAEIRQQAAENPLLVINDPEVPTGSGQPQTLENWSRPESLTDSLCRQISEMPLGRDIAALAKLLTGDLTDDGYLASTTAELAQTFDIAPASVELAIAALQACDPPGIAARTLVESLTLQLMRTGVPRDEAETVCANLELLIEGRWARAAQKTGLPRTRLEHLAQLIRTLSPRPASGFGDTAGLLIPEVMVNPDGAGGFTLSLNRASVPDVVLDAELVSNLEHDSSLAQANLRPAERLLRALRYRGQTLLDVATAVLAKQQLFFTNGPEHLLPLSRIDLAQTLGLHPSTVGRAIAGKALGFNGVTIPFANLLSPSLTKDDGTVVSTFTVQHRIRQLVDAESHGAVMNDDEIAAVLRREGVDIARRTVAKYRGCMNIPSSFERKRLLALRTPPPQKTGMQSNKR